MSAALKLTTAQASDAQAALHKLARLVAAEEQIVRREHSSLAAATRLMRQLGAHRIDEAFRQEAIRRVYARDA